jgi:hypothetical protein
VIRPLAPCFQMHKLMISSKVFNPKYIILCLFLIEFINIVIVLAGAIDCYVTLFPIEVHPSDTMPCNTTCMKINIGIFRSFFENQFFGILPVVLHMNSKACGVVAKC